MSNGIIDTLYSGISDGISQTKEHTDALAVIQQILADADKYEAIEEQAGIIASSASHEGFRAGFIAGMKLSAELKAM